MALPKKVVKVDFIGKNVLSCVEFEMLQKKINLFLVLWQQYNCVNYTVFFCFLSYY